MSNCIFLFGEAEKGAMRKAVKVHTLEELFDLYGNSVSMSMGLDYAVQALLLRQTVIFFRVGLESYAEEDYFEGVKQLYIVAKEEPLEAVCLPGVENLRIIKKATPICHELKSLLILNQLDFTNYLTSKY